MKKLSLAMAGGVMGVALLSGCATSSYSDPYAYDSGARYDSRYDSGYDSRYGRDRYASASGVIDSIQVSQDGRGGVTAGGVAGAVIGGVLGNQIGSGSGRAVATAAGAVGGALVGNELDRSNNAPMYHISVRLDGGGYRTIRQDSVANLSVGSRVRIENGRVVRY